MARTKRRTKRPSRMLFGNISEKNIYLINIWTVLFIFYYLNFSIIFLFGLSYHFSIKNSISLYSIGFYWFLFLSTLLVSIIFYSEIARTKRRTRRPPRMLLGNISEKNTYSINIWTFLSLFYLVFHILCLLCPYILLFTLCNRVTEP